MLPKTRMAKSSHCLIHRCMWKGLFPGDVPFPPFSGSCPLRSLLFLPSASEHEHGPGFLCCQSLSLLVFLCRIGLPQIGCGWRFGPERRIGSNVFVERAINGLPQHGQDDPIVSLECPVHPKRFQIKTGGILCGAR